MASNLYEQLAELQRRSGPYQGAGGLMQQIGNAGQDVLHGITEGEKAALLYQQAKSAKLENQKLANENQTWGQAYNIPQVSTLTDVLKASNPTDSTAGEPIGPATQQQSRDTRESLAQAQHIPPNMVDIPINVSKEMAATRALSGGAVDLQGNVVAPGTPGAMITKSDTAAQLAAKKAQADTKAKEKDAALTPEAINLLAERALAGSVDAMGLGQKVRVPVFNKMAELAAARGDTAGAQIIRQASLKASQGELTKVQAIQGPVLAFEKTANANLDLALNLSKLADRSGSPVVNRWLNAGKKEIAGDPAVTQFNAAVQTAINEVAKVTSGASGGAVTSDTARKEIADMLNATQTPEQFEAVVKTIKTDMANRKSGLEDQIKEIKSGIGSGTTSGTKKPKEPTSTMVAVIDPQGRKGRLPANQVGAALKAGWKRQ